MSLIYLYWITQGLEWTLVEPPLLKAGMKSFVHFLHCNQICRLAVNQRVSSVSTRGHQDTVLFTATCGINFKNWKALDNRYIVCYTGYKQESWCFTCIHFCNLCVSVFFASKTKFIWISIRKRLTGKKLYSIYKQLSMLKCISNTIVSYIQIDLLFGILWMSLLFLLSQHHNICTNPHHNPAHWLFPLFLTHQAQKGPPSS